MRLLELRLRNFKGLRDLELRPGGDDLSVFGDNGTGKTTVVDAFMWLLFDKDSANRKDFEIKTLGPDGQPIHNLEHEVQAQLELPDGQRLTLRKVFKEKWTKRRGAARAEFTGHTTEHYIDGVPVRKAEFEARIGQIADEQLFRLLTDPLHFNMNLHWQERRRLLLEVCGDVTDDEVIASDPELRALPSILNGRSLDDHRKVIQARRAEINRELDRIPVRIDEVTRSLPAVEGDPVALSRALEDLRHQRRDAEEEVVRIQAGGQIAELQKRVREIEAEMLDADRRARSSLLEALDDERDELRRLQAKIDEAERDIRRELSRSDELHDEAERLEARMNELRSQWEAVNAEAFSWEPDDECPACGQPLPAEHVQEARDKALAAFNKSKAERLERITAEGKALKRRVEELREQRRQALDRSVELGKEAARLRDQANRLKSSIAARERSLPDLSQDPEYQKLAAQRDRLLAEIESLQASNAQALEAARARVREVDEKIAGIERQLSLHDQLERGRRRIEELAAEERRLAAEFEELERQLYLTEQFVRAKVRLLEDRINSRFALARFKLFRELVNGGVEECCETTYQGVPYSSLNHGARLNVGLDIINALADHFGFAPPVWIDNAESVTQILPTRGQQIRLVVSAADKSLRVEQSASLVKEAV